MVVVMFLFVLTAIGLAEIVTAAEASVVDRQTDQTADSRIAHAPAAGLYPLTQPNTPLKLVKKVKRIDRTIFSLRFGLLFQMIAFYRRRVHIAGSARPYNGHTLYLATRYITHYVYQNS